MYELLHKRGGQVSYMFVCLSDSDTSMAVSCFPVDDADLLTATHL